MLTESDSKFKSVEYNELNKFRVKSNMVLNSDGSLSPAIYAGIITNAAWQKDTEFLEQFIEKYHNKIPAEHKENMYNLGMAYLNYARGDFDSAVEFSSKINPEIFTFKYYLKNLQLALYYELNNFEGYLYLKDAYKHFLSYSKTEASESEPIFQNDKIYR